MTFTTVLTFTVGAAFNITLLAFGARRLLGEQRFSLSRTIVAGLAGQAAGNAIINALAAGVPASVGAKGGPPYGVVIGFLALGWACALLIAMAILVVWQGAFAEIDHQPLAAASIAQVHAATLRTGQRVVVKVQRPGVASLAARDLDIIGRLARRMETRASWARTLGVVTLAEGFAAALREELDFRVEARNLAGLMAVALLALRGGPAMTAKVGFYQFLGYCLLVICSLLALRVLAAVFRRV